uniref:EF-hand calcium-binding domain containing protein n=1 Tax=Entamoeba histolytica TaxID=5759 RepID=A0A060N275_ENTHI|nr:EF-hand calcium-binding domain containing protein [Entamoeba histolytica]
MQFGYPPMQPPVANFCLWNLQPIQGSWMGAACIYQMPPSVRNTWWFPLLNTIPLDQYTRIYQWFTGVDRDRSGTLEINELMMGQFPGGIRLSPQTALRMMRIFDTDFNGHISFYEFMAMYKFMELAYNLFVMNDRNRSGTLEPHEILPALQQLGFYINQRTSLLLHRLFARGMAFCDLNCWIAICAFAAQTRSAYQMIFMNPYYGPMKPFNPMEFGKFLDVVTSLLE